MTTHHEPFSNLTHLPADLAIGFVIIYGAIIGICWDHTRPWLARTLTHWGARLG